MGQLPTGTVTMLFSDIEGSTLLVQRLGRDWGTALSAQRSMMRSCFSEHGGHELGTEGDSFFVVFGSAHEALGAATAAQRWLQAHQWPGEVPIRVRMGLHTGEPERHEDGYIGIDVHRAARIAATASGGQIVCSEATKVMLGTLDGAIVMRDLGWHRLKDIEELEHLFDVTDVEAGGLVDFPPLRSLGTRASLPRPALPLVGRSGELIELTELLGRPDGDAARLVTLTGPGGTGKTRLALAAAAALEETYEHGVFFCELHTADRPALMWAGIAETIGAVGNADEMPGPRVIRVLADRHTLLLLDNLEQIDGADEVVDQLLTQVSGVTVLATSRKPLHLLREFEFPVSPLDVPDAEARPLAASHGSAAVELFVRRATMANPRFRLTDDNLDDVAELCRRLDGLPLAIELTAARAKLLTPHAMLSHIDDRLGAGVTASDRAVRQRSLGSAIGWSYDLLDEVQQRVFRRLGVFAGATDLTAIEQVAAEGVSEAFEIVAQLVDTSLVRVADSADGEPRIDTLQTIRSFARQRLDASDEAFDVRLRHARWCRDVALEVREQLQEGGPSSVPALDRMAAVEEDVRAALEWCLRPVGEPRPEQTECGLQIVIGLHAYWYRFGYVAEGRAWYERAMALAGTMESIEVVNILHGLGTFLLQQGEVQRGREALQRAFEISQRTGDRDLEAREANSLGVAFREVGELAEAKRLVLHSLTLAEEQGSSLRAVTAQTNMVLILLDSQEYDAAVVVARKAMALDQAREDRWGVGINNTNLAWALLHAEGPGPAYEQLAAAATDTIALEDIELSIEVIELFAASLGQTGAATVAARLMGAADALRDKAGMARSAPDNKRMDDFLATVKGTMSSQQWAEAQQDGCGLTIPEAVALAVDTGRHRV